jgi:membrane protease YdiL (CAAX protease family)
LKAVLFVALAAAAVVGYLFLLQVFGAWPAAFVLACAALLLNKLFFRSEGRSLAEIGFDGPRLRVRQAAVAFIAGAMVVAIWALILVFIAGLRWHRVPQVSAAPFVAALGFTLFNNMAEELVYRGYLFVLLGRTFHPAVAVIVTSTLFTLLHIQAGVPWVNAFAGVFTSALMFAALFERWKSVPLVIGFHVAMNCAQEFLGMRVTGMTVFESVYRGPLSATQTASVLVLTAFTNIVVAALLFASKPHSR